MQMTTSRPGVQLSGFTVIEILVVMTAIALLLSVAAPRYIQHIDRSREVTLRHDLKVMRDAIDKFAADKGRYPSTLPELVALGYLSSIPVDPMTGSAVTWLTSPPTAALVSWQSGMPPTVPAPEGAALAGVGDVHSTATGLGSDGTPYASW
ncbi:type II secretion system protein [Roseateles sp.]|uniref:type II secretion system protein n=1 Tax=Roseateles sp. TaxID=1971397 RepID=UPI0039E7C13F